MAEILQEVSESFDLFNGRRSDRSTGCDMFPDVIQRRVQVFSGRSVEPQRDVIRHTTKLLSTPPSVRVARSLHRP